MPDIDGLPFESFDEGEPGHTLHGGRAGTAPVLARAVAERLATVNARLDAVDAAIDTRIRAAIDTALTEQLPAAVDAALAEMDLPDAASLARLSVLTGMGADAVLPAIVAEASTVLTPLENGPEVTVNVPASGRVLLLASTNATSYANSSTSFFALEAVMNGANTGPAGPEHNYLIADRTWEPGSPAFNSRVCTAWRNTEELNPGATTFTLASYSPDGSVFWADTRLIVIPLW